MRLMSVTSLLTYHLGGFAPNLSLRQSYFHFRRREFSTLVISTDELERMGNPELRRNFLQLQTFVENPSFDL